MHFLDASDCQDSASFAGPKCNREGDFVPRSPNVDAVNRSSGSASVAPNVDAVGDVGPTFGDDDGVDSHKIGRA